MFICPRVFRRSGRHRRRHGDQEVTGLAVFQKVVFDFIEGWEVFTGSSQFLDPFLKVGGRDAEGVGFSCGVDVCQYYMVCQSQCFGEFREQSFGTGVGMGLEDTPGLFVRIVFGRGQCCFDLCRMMGVVIDHSDIADVSFELKTAVGSGEVDQTFLDRCIVHAQFFTQSDHGKGVGHVVDTGYLQGEGSCDFTVMQTGKGRVTEGIVCNIGCCIISFMLQSVSDDFAWQIPDDILIMRSITVDDQGTVSRKFFCKQPEGMADIVNILKEIQMIGIHVQDDTDFGKSLKSCWYIHRPR